MDEQLVDSTISTLITPTTRQRNRLNPPYRELNVIPHPLKSFGEGNDVIIKMEVIAHHGWCNGAGN